MAEKETVETDFDIGNNLALDEKGQFICSDIYGRLKVEGPYISVLDTLMVSEDQYRATMDIMAKGISRRPLKSGIIRGHLEDQKITHGIDDDAIRTAIMRSKKTGQVQENIVVAQGTPAVYGSDAQVKFTFRIGGAEPMEFKDSENETLENARRDFILKGKTMAEVKEHQKSEDGMTIYGRKVHTTKPRVIDIRPGDNVTTDKEKHLFTAAAHGFCDYSGGTVSLIPLFEVTSDKMSAQMTLYPPHTVKRTLTREVILRLLHMEKIVYGIDERAIEEAVSGLGREEVRSEELGVRSEGLSGIPESDNSSLLTPNSSLPHSLPVKKVIARGREPQDGKDGFLEHHVSFSKKVGTKRPDGSVDYRERNFIPTVSKGDLIITRHPPSRGRSGTDVFGHEREAKNGVDAPLVAGEGVKLVNEYSYYSIMDGAASLRERELRVHNVFVVNGDVDYNTGNIHFDGTVKITGSVRSAFSVEAKGSIYIEGTVDDALIEASENVVIQGGIFHKESGLIKAKGTVEAFFATNANIEAVESIVICNDAVNCNLQTEGTILISKGKGRAVGGRLVAGELIEVRELGSEGAITTIVEIAPPKRIEDSIIRIALEIKNVEALIEKVSTKLHYLSQKGLETLPPEQKATAMKLRAAKETLVKRRDDMFEAKEAALQEKEDFEGGWIKIIGTMWPGVEVRIKNQTFKPNKPLHGTGFKYSRERDSLERL
jgi:uncharacterized protein (DUF342 family)